MTEESTAQTDLGGRIVEKILVLRGQRVILDTHLADLYGTSTKRLNEQVKRNASRFPRDFMFRLTPEEVSAVNWSQFATTSQKHRRGSHSPYAFTEHGAVMAASVINTNKAIEMSLYVVRAFVRLRQLLASNAELKQLITGIEARLGAKLLDHEMAISEILGVLRHLVNPPEKVSRGIGFTADV